PPSKPVLPPGMRAVAVPVELVPGSGPPVLPGHRVDVVLATPQADPKDRAKIILQNIVVLAVDEKLPQAEERLWPPIVTLLVNPDQALELIAAHKAGTIHLLVRPRGD